MKSGPFAIVSANARELGESLSASVAVGLACIPANRGWQNGKRVLITRINLAVSVQAGASGTVEEPARLRTSNEAACGSVAMSGSDMLGPSALRLAANILYGKFITQSWPDGTV